MKEEKPILNPLLNLTARKRGKSTTGINPIKFQPVSEYIEVS
jgi:hypothetical protein